MWNPILAQAGKTFWLPERASTVAPGSDLMFYWIYWICVFFFALVTFLLVLFAIKYRHREGVKRDTSVGHNNTLEITWTVIPSIIVVFLYYYGFKQYMNMAVEPPNAYEITVNGKMWNWTFNYPNGLSYGELHVPPNKPVRCVLESNDVIHSLSIPAFRVKKDVVPGRFNRIWFEAVTPGTYEIFCTAYCGTNHSTMRTKAVVHNSMAEFEQWLKEETIKAENLPPVEKGRKLYQTMGCIQCHSIDQQKTRIIGPPWRDMFGAMQPIEGGAQVLADESYVRESVRIPSAKIHAGYPNQMTPFPESLLPDKDLSAIIEFMKSISSNYHGPPPGAGTQPTSGPSTQPATAPSRPIALAN
jgi:cytochrome c oxidase subunit 2